MGNSSEFLSTFSPDFPVKDSWEFPRIPGKDSKGFPRDVNDILKDHNDDIFNFFMSEKLANI